MPAHTRVAEIPKKSGQLILLYLMSYTKMTYILKDGLYYNYLVIQSINQLFIRNGSMLTPQHILNSTKHAQKI